MSYIKSLIEEPSESYKIERTGKTVQIRPLNGAQLASLKAFQPIANKVLKSAGQEGYQVLIVHESDRFSGNLYDLIVLIPRKITASTAPVMS